MQRGSWSIALLPSAALLQEVCEVSAGWDDQLHGCDAMCLGMGLQLSACTSIRQGSPKSLLHATHRAIMEGLTQPCKCMKTAIAAHEMSKPTNPMGSYTYMFTAVNTTKSKQRIRRFSDALVLTFLYPSHRHLCMLKSKEDRYQEPEVMLQGLCIPNQTTRS